MKKQNESDLDYLKRLRGQLIIAKTGLQALNATYKEINNVFNDLDLSDILMSLVQPLTRIALNCESQIKLVEEQIENEELYPQNIPIKERLTLIFFNKNK